MDDRFVRGFIAGITAWLPTFVVNYAMEVFGVSRLMFKDFLAVMIFGRLVGNYAELFFAYIALIGFLAVLGVIFAYLILGIGEKYLYFKGINYSLTLWFSFYAITHLYRMHELTTIDLGTAIGNFLGASVWGLCLVIVWQWLTRKFGTLGIQRSR